MHQEEAEEREPDGAAQPRLARTARRVQERALAARGRAEHRMQAVREASPAPVRRAWLLTESTVRETFDDRVPGLAAEAALFTLISLPALLLTVLGSLGYVASALGPAGTAELHRLVYDVPQAFLSDQTYATWSRLAGQVLDQGRADVISISAAISLWTGSRAMARYLETITIAYDLEIRAGWRRRLLALGLTLGALLAAVTVLPLLVVGPKVVGAVTPRAVAGPTLALLHHLYWPVVLLFVLVCLATLYHLGAPWRTPWRRDLPGAVLALVIWLLASAGLRAYLALTLQKDALYSQLGTPIAVVLWFYVTAIAVLLGAELNAEVERTWPTADHDRPRADEPSTS